MLFGFNALFWLVVTLLFAIRMAQELYEYYLYRQKVSKLEEIAEDI